MFCNGIVGQGEKGLGGIYLCNLTVNIQIMDCLERQSIRKHALISTVIQFLSFYSVQIYDTVMQK